MPAWTTPELRPVWCTPTRSSFSRTSRCAAGWRAASSRATARPTMPPPTTAIVRSLIRGDYDEHGRRSVVRPVAAPVASEPGPTASPGGSSMPDLSVSPVPVAQRLTRFVRQHTEPRSDPQGIRRRRPHDVAACARLAALSWSGTVRHPAWRDWLTAEEVVEAWVAEHQG